MSELERKWELGRDRYGRRVTLTWETPHDWTLRTEPSSQRDDGEVHRSLSADLLIEAGRIAKEFRK